MFAIVETVGSNSKLQKIKKFLYIVCKIKKGERDLFDKVLLLDDGKITVGAPAISGAAVEANVLGHLKSDKVIVFKKNDVKVIVKKWTPSSIN